MDFAYLGSIALLIFGFGFVIFWHELGHFLAAKWAGVKVEQFAVGFGQAMLSWRQGLGVRWGSSRDEYDQRLHEYLRVQADAENKSAELAEATSEERRLEYAAQQLGISETEYRLNWIPLGGYVKMLGQDDMNPNSLSDSPRAYNKKPIGKRMIIVSAGVVMNIILAIVLFTVLFRMGFDVPPAVVGVVFPGSPAQQAGVRVGDRILTYDGAFQHDYNKVVMSVALSEKDKPVKLRVRRPNGMEEELTVTPRASEVETAGMLATGIYPSMQLKGDDAPKNLPDEAKAFIAKQPVRPGETVVAINGKPVGINDYYVLDEAVQDGKPVPITVETATGAREERTVEPHLISPFGQTPLQFAGMLPRTVIAGIEASSSAKGKLKDDDIVLEVTTRPNNDTTAHPDQNQLRKVLGNASEKDLTVDMTVLRDDKSITITDLKPNMRLEGQGGKRGIGIAMSADENHPVVAGVLAQSAAATAGITGGETIKSINGTAVGSWHDVLRILKSAVPDQPLAMELVNDRAEPKTVVLKLTADQLAGVNQNRYSPNVLLRPMSEPRKTKNPLEAASWGVSETRDLLLQFYLTIQRMTQGSVPASNMMGPLGIFHTGSKIANRGTDWLIWFLAMISANLAVVNFLPIPIVDGGLFVFLIVEKIMGKPLSQRTQSIAQIVGLALIASVFLFVTYHDIARMVF